MRLLDGNGGVCELVTHIYLKMIIASSANCFIRASAMGVKYRDHPRTASSLNTIHLSTHASFTETWSLTNNSNHSSTSIEPLR
jgi:hypothetical protein